VAQEIAEIDPKRFGTEDNAQNQVQRHGFQVSQKLDEMVDDSAIETRTSFAR
jgi:hypothetical protein